MNDSVILLDDDKYLSHLKSISLFEGKNNLYIIEEGIKSGGYGEKVSSLVEENNISCKVKIRALNEYVEHGSVEELWERHGLSKECIIKFISEK